MGLGQLLHLDEAVQRKREAPIRAVVVRGGALQAAPAWVRYGRLGDRMKSMGQTEESVANGVAKGVRRVGRRGSAAESILRLGACTASS